MVLLTFILDVSHISYRDIKGKLINDSNTVIKISINNSSEIEIGHIGSILTWTPLSYFKYENNALSYVEREIYIKLSNNTENNQNFINSIALEDYSKKILGIIRKNGPDRFKKDLSHVTLGNSSKTTDELISSKILGSQLFETKILNEISVFCNKSERLFA